MKKLVCILFFLCFSCMDEENARKQLKQEGYTDIEITGYRPLYCFPQEKISTGFIAKDSKGIEHTGSVCCSFVCVVRTNDNWF